tara:strand:- start:2315 stop:2803 length:489 start_codon:yes stop_codon:yes gene_type:complete
MSKTIKNVFVSHHHKDDASVDGLTRLAANKGFNLRNSSIRAKPENQKRIDTKKIPEQTIKRLLRMKMKWASQLIVVIGKETHSRDWVNWEIEQAHKMGMPIVGVYENRLTDKVELPEKLKDYATSIVSWRSESIIDALKGASNFQNPDGTPADKMQSGNVVC